MVSMGDFLPFFTMFDAFMDMVVSVQAGIMALNGELIFPLMCLMH